LIYPVCEKREIEKTELLKLGLGGNSAQSPGSKSSIISPARLRAKIKCEKEKAAQPGGTNRRAVGRKKKEKEFFILGLRLYLVQKSQKGALVNLHQKKKRKGGLKKQPNEESKERRWLWWRGYLWGRIESQGGGIESKSVLFSKRGCDRRKKVKRIQKRNLLRERKHSPREVKLWNLRCT